MTRTRRANNDSLPLVIGHRGASFEAPENTLAAFDLALAQGADGVEFDVRLASDGVAVVVHDATLRRTARLDARVNALTSAELRALDASTWFNARSNGKRVQTPREGIPTLDETLALVAPRSRVIYVELKCEAGDDYIALAAAVVRVIRRHNLEERAVVKCFQHGALREVRRLAPELRTAALFERTPARPLISASAIVSAALACDAAEVSLHRSLLRRAVVRAAQARNLRTLVWTIDTPAALRRACAAGVSAFFTNRPALMRAILAELSTAARAVRP